MSFCNENTGNLANTYYTLKAKLNTTITKYWTKETSVAYCLLLKNMPVLHCPWINHVVIESWHGFALPKKPLRILLQYNFKKENWLQETEELEDIEELKG